MARSADTPQTKYRAPFGIPGILVAHFEEKGIPKAQLEGMEFNDILKEAGDLSTQTLQKTLVTVLKTSRHIDMLQTRLRLLIKPKISAEGVDPLLEIMNLVMQAYDLNECPSKSELLEFAWIRALEGEMCACKLVSRFVLTHIELTHAEIVEFMEKKWEEGFESMDMLMSGNKKERIDHILQLLTILAKKATEELPFWQKTLELYRHNKEQELPMETLKTFGWTVLKTVEKENLKEAFIKYTRAMQKKVFEFKYIQLFISLFAGDLPNLQFLLYYVLSESRVGGNTLCSVEVPHIPLEVFTAVLQKLPLDKINIRTTVPVLKNIIRKEKGAPTKESLLEIEQIVLKLKTALKAPPLDGILAYVQSMIASK